MLSPVSVFANYLNFVEYNPLTLSWFIRRQSFSPRTFFQGIVDFDCKLNDSYIINNHFTLDSDFEHLKQHYTESDFFAIDNPVTPEMMDNLHLLDS